jgi:hypothetical protein
MVTSKKSRVGRHNFFYMLFNQQQCFIYSTASFLSKLRAKKVEKLCILVIKQLPQMTAYRKFRILARIYEPLVLVNTVISWIRLADLNPCTTCTMYISLTIFLFRSGIAFLRVLVIKQLLQMTAYRKFRKWNTGIGFWNRKQLFPVLPIVKKNIII